MSQVSLLNVMRDSFGTAEGICLRCGAFLSVTLPTEHSAAQALSELFDKHMAEKHTDELDEREARLLDQAVTKLVSYGQRVGVSPAEMISLLDSGMSIRGLLEFLASKPPGGNSEPSASRAESVR